MNLSSSSSSSSALLYSYSLLNNGQADSSFKDIEEAIYLQRVSIASQNKLYSPAVPHEISLRKFVLVRGVWNAARQAQTQLTDRTTNALMLLAETVAGVSSSNGVADGQETHTEASAKEKQPSGEQKAPFMATNADTQNNAHNSDNDDLVSMELIRALSLPPFVNPLAEENEYDWSWLNGPSSSATTKEPLHNDNDTQPTSTTATTTTVNNNNVNTSRKRSRAEYESEDASEDEEEVAQSDAHIHKKRRLQYVPADTLPVSPPKSPPSPSATTKKKEELLLLLSPNTVSPPNHRIPL